ncbi:CLUMA_CG007550, isoform A [Clunio marinus]|uniref:CLUMA_CG007550, isoform A n=1 Tax=Clunio marinus TaxID=568069 RepID=A0A1J1I2N1_9DIPT|nr:CLUMA_CG007550, isoform A [Clunio marinus]
MPRKRASGSSPDKPNPTPRRNTRRGRNKSEEPEEVPAEIPRHLLRGSDESSEESDNDSDYGSPKKGRGRARGRGRKAKEPAVTTETPVQRPRRGRKTAAAAAASTTITTVREPSPDHADHSQSTQETGETTTENEASEPSSTVKPTQEQGSESAAADYVLIESSPVEINETSSEPVTHDNDPGKVSEVTIEQDSYNDQAPVEQEEDGSKENDVETGRESVDNVKDTSEVVVEKKDSPSIEPERIEIETEPIEEDAPESSANQSESRSNSSEKEVYKKNRRRSRSSSGEIPEESMEVVEESKERISHEPEKKKETTPEVKKTVEEKPFQRKRKWTARKTDDQPVIAITTDSLKTIISEEVKPVPLSDVKLLTPSPDREPEEKRLRTKSTADDKDAKKKLLKERLRKQEEEEERRNEMLVKAIDKTQASSNGATASNGTAVLLKDRKISMILDDSTSAQPPSPPKNESSNILYITNLVRPFTLLQLKHLLLRTGKIVENGFWIDKIKSKCYVKYETEDEASETRHALHGVTWPSSNPKCLNVDFGKEEDMEKAILSTLDDFPRIQITTENRSAKEEKDFGWSKDPYKTSSVEDRSRPSHNRPVREWDVGKKDKEEYEREDRDRSRRRRSSERENRREKDHIKKEERPERRRSLSESPGRKVEKIEGDSQPVRLLDDLFRKTKAIPCIYWLPLSAEQIVEKEEQRQKNLAEHERRMEEVRKQREERMRERRRSNSRDRRRERSRDRRRRSVSRDRRYNRR